MDREKVIKGLECHRIDNNHRINCADCPYYVDDDNHIRCVNDLHDDALALLKEQEAVKPEPIMGTSISDCGKCRHAVAPGMDYCPVCGCRIDWN